MKVLLKREGDGQFVRDSKGWTRDSAQAMDFKTTPAALAYSQLHGLTKMLILLKFREACHDLELKNCC
jgi:hypothetical protein